MFYQRWKPLFQTNSILLVGLASPASVTLDRFCNREMEKFKEIHRLVSEALTVMQMDLCLTVSYGDEAITAQSLHASHFFEEEDLICMSGPIRATPRLNRMRASRGLQSLESIDSETIEAILVTNCVSTEHLVILQNPTAESRIAATFGDNSLQLLRNLLLPVVGSERYVSVADKLEMTISELLILRPAPVPSVVISDFCALKCGLMDFTTTQEEWHQLQRRCCFTSFHPTELASLKKLVEAKIRQRSLRSSAAASL